MISPPKVDHFIGVDLSWRCEPYKERATALCMIDSEGKVEYPYLITGDEEIISAIPKNGGAWIGVDSPLLVPNEKGMRAGEREASHGGLHILPTNRSFLNRSCGGIRGEQLALKVLERGFSLAHPGDDREMLLFESYPYSLVHSMFPERISYKRGSAPEKRKACQDILVRLQGWERSLRLPPGLFEEVREARPADMKEVADKVDAVLCAACVYAHWLYGGQRTRLVGDEKDGYILII